MKLTTVMVVDDHQLVREGIIRLLAEDPTIEVVAEAASGEEAIVKAAEKSPDLILMDINMPGLGGLGAMNKIMCRHPRTKVIALTSHIQNPLPRRVLEAGARGYLTKGASAARILEAIHTVLTHKVYLDPVIAERLALSNIDQNPKSPLNDLSKRELEVLLKVIQGIDANEIAKTLCISAKTVNTYRYRIYEKLNVHNDVELTLFALRHGLLEEVR